jgi:hypothetical protein
MAAACCPQRLESAVAAPLQPVLDDIGPLPPDLVPAAVAPAAVATDALVVLVTDSPDPNQVGTLLKAISAEPAAALVSLIAFDDDRAVLRVVEQQPGALIPALLCRPGLPLRELTQIEPGRFRVRLAPHRAEGEPEDEVHGHVPLPRWSAAPISGAVPVAAESVTATIAHADASLAEAGPALPAELPVAAAVPPPARTEAPATTALAIPAAEARATPRPQPSTTGGDADQLTVVAYPFASFTLLNSFIQSISGLGGVGFVTPRRFRGGSLQLAVDYAGGEPLAERIERLEQFHPRVSTGDDGQITVVIEGAA